jgi:hypothetical protein
VRRRDRNLDEAHHARLRELSTALLAAAKLAQHAVRKHLATDGRKGHINFPCLRQSYNLASLDLLRVVEHADFLELRKVRNSLIHSRHIFKLAAAMVAR